MSSKHWLGIAAALGFAVATASAQPVERDHRRPPPPPPPGGVTVGGSVGVNVGVGPTQPPPAPQVENPGARAGFEWVSGRWDWRGNKWQWMAGHWERERAGKHWHPGRWEHRGDKWAWVEGQWAAGEAPPPAPPGTPVTGPGFVPPGDEPNAAPPPPPAENPGARAGFEWVAGRYNWRDHKWQWMPGHWERERAGQHWHPGRWDRRDGHWIWVEGTWGAGPVVVETPPAPPGPPMPEGEHHHREWRLERPTVSSYWPQRGTPGKHVVIRGENFPPDTKVMWGAQPVMAAKISPDEIRFEVPPGAPSATILLDVGHRHDLVVGNFDTSAGGPDPAIAERQREDELRKQAEQRWAEQQKQMAKDRAAREAEWKRRWEQMDQTREQRREQREQEIRAKWDAAFLADPDTQDELTLHAQRVAELARALDVAQLDANGKLVVRVQVAQGREQDRHDQRMAALKAAFAAKGGAR
ncbi:MAG: IPT/TIG domain-containing protein [Acidobacteriota bacterium]